jgi:uridylate kinase
MNLNNQSAMTLAKANMAMSLKLCSLMRHYHSQVMGDMQKHLDACQAEFEAKTQESINANDWTGIMTAWMNSPLVFTRLQNTHMQEAMQTAMSAQLTLNNEMKDAMGSWQKETAAAMQEGVGAMPMSTTMRDYFNGYLKPTTEARPA